MINWQTLISIHAPRTGSDNSESTKSCTDILISIHAPRTGSDPYCHFVFGGTGGFQSTLPARGATGLRLVCNNKGRHFNPRSPHGERRDLQSSRLSVDNFNPRSPHGERRSYRFFCLGKNRFQSTLPARGATWRFAHVANSDNISIHAPRTGSDFVVLMGLIVLHHFNPRSPHGERRFDTIQDCIRKVFQSTLPARGAT